MKHFYLLFIFVLSLTSVYPQFILNDWRTPKALSDSSSDNLNAFLLSNGSNPTVVWQKVINENTTALYMKSINDSTDVEHLVLETEGVQYKPNLNRRSIIMINILMSDHILNLC